LPAEIAAGPHWQSWAALAVLGLVCSALAFVLFFRLIGLIGVARSSLIVYVNMAVALALGIVFLKEPITTGFLIGVPMVIVGLLLAGRKRS
jgi:drug/metabolite transporter (DMT)-like permease